MSKTKFYIDQNIMVTIRTFNSDIKLLWKTWAQAELLDQWWAPFPWISTTREMEFKEDGYRLYTMKKSDNEIHYCQTIYKKIKLYEYFKGADYFCDSTGKIDFSLPVTYFNTNFYSQESTSTLVITTVFDTKEKLEQMVRMGIEEGLSKAFENLDHVLVELNTD